MKETNIYTQIHINISVFLYIDIQNDIKIREREQVEWDQNIDKIFESAKTKYQRDG